MCLLLVTTSFSQTYYFKKAIIVPMNQTVIDYYTEMLHQIASIDGKTTVEVPYEIDVKKNTKTKLIDNFLVQYEVTNFAGNKSITIFPAKCKVYEFDFKKKKIKKKISKNTDEGSIFRPVDLKERLEKVEKIKPKKIKP